MFSWEREDCTAWVYREQAACLGPLTSWVRGMKRRETVELSVPPLEGREGTAIGNGGAGSVWLSETTTYVHAWQMGSARSGG